MVVLPENDPALRSFIDVQAEHPFPIQNLPFGIFCPKSGGQPRVGVAIGDFVLDLACLEEHRLFDGPLLSGKIVFQQSTLNVFMALGKAAWREARARVSYLLRAETATLRDNANLRKVAFFPQQEVRLLLPIQISGYTDFYSSKEHARNVGMLFRSKENPLLPNWVHLPVAYDGRASTIVVSGTPFHRPKGQTKPDENSPPMYGPTRQLDTEVEVAFIVGTPNHFGEPISVQAATDHVFGMALLADWSARDIQKWEYVPLGPFLGKNFCTSLSPWIVTLDALEPFRCQSGLQDPVPLPYLQSSRDWAYDIHLALLLQTAAMEKPQRVSLTNYRHIYWDYCQQLAHHTVNGCRMQTGDVFASGTISGGTRDACGSLLEITWAGAEPIKLTSGEERRFLEDGDRAIIQGWCQGDGYRVGFGEVMSTVLAC